MATRPVLDFSHLTPSERIELAEQLWDSLEPEAFPVSDAQASELRRRRAAMDKSPPGQPWQEALDEIDQRGG
jgi:putative addiction module component (TIGR02574 family)